jgi:hypothetical protein
MRYLSIAIMLVAAVSLTGCDRTRRALGLNKTVPDEFAVATPAPLAIPPDFNLRPPAPGSERTPEATPAEQGRAVLLGRARLLDYQKRGFSNGETAILGAAGADAVLPDIRNTIAKEISTFAPEERAFSDRLLFWRDGASVPGAIVDPAAEMKRLSQNAAEGKKPNEGASVIIRRGKSSTLGIF